MKKLSYLNHIDALRAIAVLLVVLFHLDIELFKGGFLGVDVFFVISGFLITRILKHEFEKHGKINFKEFYLKRVRRLFPTLYLTLFLSFVLTLLTFSPSDFINAINSMFMSSIAISNFHFLSESDYFDTASSLKPLLHTWSLGIEEQFYLIFPVTLFLLMKFFYKKKRVLYVLLILFVLSFSYTCYTSISGVSIWIHDLFLSKNDISSSDESIHFFLLPFRMYEFLIGAMLAYAGASKVIVKSESLKFLINILGLTLVIVPCFIFSKDTSFLSLFNIVPCIGAGVLLFFPPSNYLSILFENKFLKHIGKISYTLYLLHWLIIVVYKYVIDREFVWIEQLALFIIMLLLSIIVYKYYETPLRYKNSKFSISSDKLLIGLLLSGIVSLFLLSYTIKNNNGWLWRLNTEQNKFIKKFGGTTNNFHLNNWGGAGYLNKEGTFLISKKRNDKKLDLIMLGDSHAGHLSYGIDSLIVKENSKNVYIPFWCSSLRLPDLIVNKTPKRKEQSIFYFEKDMKTLKSFPDVPVLLSQSWLSQMNRSAYLDSLTNSYIKMPIKEKGYNLLFDKILKLHEIIGTERKLIIIGDTHRDGLNISNYIEKVLRPQIIPFKTKKQHINTFSKNKIRSNFNIILNKLLQNQENIYFIDPTSALCNEEGSCITEDNAGIYYSDGGHLSKDGSLKVIRYIKNNLLEIIN